MNASNLPNLGVYCFALLLLFAGLTPAHCDENAQRALEMPMSHSVVENIASAIEAQYILPEKARHIAQQLRSNVTEGRYTAGTADVKSLATLLSRDLKAISEDGHMMVEHVDQEKGEDGWIAEWIAKAPSVNYGFDPLEFLPGDIAYLKITTFYSPELIEAPFQAVMEQVIHSRGLILDLRNNPGGDGDGANHIMATFLPKGIESPLLIESRVDNKLSQSPMELPTELSWARYLDKKMLILVNRKTFSAPESLAFALQDAGRAKVIGTPTGGGAHMLEAMTPVAGGFLVGIPTKRPVGRYSGKTWEGRGVAPDFLSDDENALRLALEQF